eukprot:scaffold10156_cov97-Cyclotella_meneghiniana.AAC.3
MACVAWCVVHLSRVQGLLIVVTVAVDRRIVASFLACDCSRRQAWRGHNVGAVVGRQSCRSHLEEMIASRQA